MSYLREDFWATTSNKQLNFLQHVRSLLTINGCAAIMVPDNVLFEGGGRRDGAPPPAGGLRRPHPPAPAYRHFLSPGCKSQRSVL